MGGGWYTEEEPIRLTYEQMIADEAARIERYCDYVVTSVEHEPESIRADYNEIVESLGSIRRKMSQVGKEFATVASIIRRRPFTGAD